VAKGYGRGSKQLAVPTANLPHFDKEFVSEWDEKRGVYFGWSRLENDNDVYPCVANIGKSPTFVGEENIKNIVEVHIIAVARRGSRCSNTEVFWSRFDETSNLLGWLSRSL